MSNNISRWLLLLLLLVLAAGVSYAILSLPTQADGLTKQVAENIELSGVSNPVTAVLLNFRGYDTLLETVVLLLALMGVWALGSQSSQPTIASGPVLDLFVRLLTPVMILVAAYLLWVGAHAPGGAFQAGSVLAAAGVMLTLAGWRLSPRFSGLPLRIVLIAGPGLFIVVAALMLLVSGNLLEFPPSQAGTIILLLETAATVSIGVTLAALYLGGPFDNKEKQ